ncbi:MAG: hypothetical protein U0670_03385 [Anaerolineae bacterium]
MFRLDDQWISGYIGVIGGLIAFVIGVSALVLQVALPSYLRTLTRRRHLMDYTTALMVFYVIVAVVLIWVAPLSADGEVSPEWTWILDIVMTITLAVTVIYAIHQLGQINGDSIVKGLVKDGKRDYIRTGTFDPPPEKQSDHQDMVYVSPLETLIDIGTQSSPGFEKQRVLSALQQLSDFMFVLPPNAPPYDGTRLRKLIDGYERVLTGGEMGSQENFKAAAAQLRVIIDKLCGNRGDGIRTQEITLHRSQLTALTARTNFADKGDLAEAMRVCSALGSLATEHFSLAVAESFVSAINMAETEDKTTFRAASIALSEIGLAAIRHQRYAISVSAVHTIMQWGPEPFEADDDGTAEMLGLWASLYGANPAGRQYILTQLDHTRERFIPSFEECIHGALDYHYISNAFETHEKVLRFLHDVTGQPTQME